MSQNVSLSSGVPDETSAELLNDAVNLIASTTINGVAYGIMLTLYGICVYYTVCKTARDDQRRAWFYLAYMTVMFILGTLYTACNSRTIQLGYVNHRLFSLGPAAYDQLIFSQPISILGNVSSVLLDIMTNVLLLWRFLILYQGCRFYWAVIAFPCLLLLSDVAISLISLVQSCLPNQSLWSASTVLFTVPSLALSVSFAIIINLLMAGRLQMYKRLEKNLGLGRVGGHGSPYTTVTTILVESAALYAVWSLVFLILYVINNPIQYVFLGSLGQVGIIAPLLITLRVSQGRAWTGKTQSTLLSTFKAVKKPTPHYGKVTQETETKVGSFSSDSESTTLDQGRLQTLNITRNSESGDYV